MLFSVANLQFDKSEEGLSAAFSAFRKIFSSLTWGGRSTIYTLLYIMLY